MACGVATERRRAYFNLECNLTEYINRLQVDVSLFYRPNIVYHKLPVDATEDFCDFITYRDPWKTPLLCQSGLFDILNKTSNVMRCSYEPAQYYIRKLLIYEKPLVNHSLALPDGDYQVLVLLINERKEIVANITVYYQVHTRAIRKIYRNRTYNPRSLTFI